MPLKIRGSSQILNSTISLSKLNNQGGTIAGNLTLSGDSITVNNDLETQSTTNLGESSDDTTTCSGTLSANAIESTPIGSSTSSTGDFTTISSSGVSTLNSLTVSNDGSIGGNLTVDGNIIISGTSVQMDVSGFKTEDSMFQLSKGNSSNLLDIGFFSKTVSQDPDLDSIDYPSLKSPITRDDLGWDPDTLSGDIGSVDFGKVTAMSGNGNVLASYFVHKRYNTTTVERIYIYDWNDSTKEWEYRNYITYDTYTGDAVLDISLDYTGDHLLFAIAYAPPINYQINTTPGRVYIYEWKDTDNDNVKDSWVSSGSYVGSGIGNTYDNCCIVKKSNGDIIHVLGSQYYPYSSQRSSSSNKGLIRTYIKYSGDSSFTLKSDADLLGSGGEGYGAGGVSLNLDGTKMAVGSYYGTPASNYWPGNGSDGYVDIYNWNSVDETWELEDTIESDNSSYFGTKPCFDGDGLKIAIGENSETRKGKVHFFKYNSTSEEWESDSDNYPAIVGESYSQSNKLSITSDFSKIIVGGEYHDSLYYNNGDYTNHPELMDGAVRTYIYNSGDSSWNEVYHPDYSIDKFTGLIRDADDSGKFKLFSTVEDIPSTSTVNFVGADTETLLATIEGNVIGNLTGNVTGNASTMSKLQTPRTISLGSDLSGSVSFDGSGDVTLNATIVDGSIQLSNIDFFVDEDDLGGLSSSDVKVPSQQSVKKYVDDRVSDGGYAELETKDIKMANSDGDFVKTKKIVQTSLIGSSDITNGYVSLSTNVETQFEHLSSVFLNGIKLRFGTSTQVSNSQRDYYFDDTTKNKIYFSSNIITQNDKLEIRYFVLS